MKKRAFWDRLQEAMKDQKLKPTQKAAGALVGIKQSSTNKWAHGGLPSFEHVVILAIKLHVSVEWLLSERGPKRPLDTEATYLLDAFARLPSQRLKDKALAYIDALTDRGPPSSTDEIPTRLS